jgi:hypothetical protein
MYNDKNQQLRPTKMLGLAFTLMLATLGYAQSAVPSSSPRSTQKPILPQSSAAVSPSLSFGSFTKSCVYKTLGAGAYRCFDSRITLDARVFAAVSEYSTDPTQRFLGAAWMTVHNVIPQNGYVDVVFDTGWTAWPINVRLDLLIDP